jgi:Xaa-Pro aminopeptidase
MKMINGKGLAKFTTLLDKAGYDALLVGPSPDMEYLSGLVLHPDERFKVLVCFRDGRLCAVSPKLYVEQMRNALGDAVEMVVWDDAEWFEKKTVAAFEKWGLRNGRIAVNEGIRAVDMLNLQERFAATFGDGHFVGEEARLRKDAEEIHRMRRAGQIADAALEALTKEIRPGVTERTLAKRLEELLLEKGATDLSFGCIVAFGANGAYPHYNGGGAVLREKDSVLIDFGCKFEGYCSDTTRTFFVGNPTEEERYIYETVLEANLAGEAACAEGAVAQDIDRAARGVIAKAGFGEYFISRTGHGIGVAIHENPYIREGNTQMLERGMAFSVEPGIYIPGKIGVRIEDVMVLTDEGPEPMSHFPKELTVL